MAGKKGRSGGPGRKQGRRRTDFRGLQLTGLDISEPTTGMADVTIRRCHACGSVWWDSYTETVTGMYQEEPDEQGYHWPVVGEVSYLAMKERHRRGCPAAEDCKV